MMMHRSYSSLLMLLVVIGVAVASENYLDYGELEKANDSDENQCGLPMRVEKCLERSTKKPLHANLCVPPTSRACKDGTADKNLESQREFYRVLLRRNAALMGEWPSQIYSHLMTRKSQRSPSLRLRFGRSEPVIPAGILTRQEDGPSPFDNN